MPVAITRPVSSSFDRCELTYRTREPIDLDLARSQHEEYERALVAMGCRIERLSEEPDLPDAVFVEDAAVVLDELAILTRPGAESRLGELASVARALGRHRPTAQIDPPGTLDGGDVLQVGRVLFVGASRRSNRAGMDQLAELTRPWGYSVRPVALEGCLHLKSAATLVASGVVLVHRAWVDVEALAPLTLVDVDASEPEGGNALWIGDAVLYPAAYPRTARGLTERGIRVHSVDVSELAKAEGGVSCCSLILNEVPA